MHQKYIVDKGWIDNPGTSLSAMISYEISEEFLTFKDAEKEFESRKRDLAKNEYIAIYIEDDEDISIVKVAYANNLKEYLL